MRRRIKTPSQGYAFLATDILYEPILICLGQKRASYRQIREAKDFLQSKRAQRLLTGLNIDYDAAIEKFVI